MESFPRLRTLGPLARVGLAAVMLVVIGGVAASMVQIVNHYAKRDGDPALSMLDLKGAYHGVSAPAPMATALARNHPPQLAQNKRAALEKWLKGNKLATDYDNLDLGDFAPAEIIAADCLACHGRASKDPIAKAIPLDDWENVKRFVFTKSIDPTPADKLVTSTHAHGPALATLTIALALLLLLTTWPRRLIEITIALLGVGLLLDIGGWWIARSQVSAVYLIVVAGGVYNLATVIASILILIELCRSKLPRA